jgi:hypothetical protein
MMSKLWNDTKHGITNDSTDRTPKSRALNPNREQVASYIAAPLGLQDARIRLMHPPNKVDPIDISKQKRLRCTLYIFLIHLSTNVHFSYTFCPSHFFSVALFSAHECASLERQRRGSKVERKQSGEILYGHRNANPTQKPFHSNAAMQVKNAALCRNREWWYVHG